MPHHRTRHGACGAGLRIPATKVARPDPDRGIARLLCRCRRGGDLSDLAALPTGTQASCSGCVGIHACDDTCLFRSVSCEWHHTDRRLSGCLLCGGRALFLDCHVLDPGIRGFSTLPRDFRSSHRSRSGDLRQLAPGPDRWRGFLLCARCGASRIGHVQKRAQRLVASTKATPPKTTKEATPMKRLYARVLIHFSPIIRFTFSK